MEREEERATGGGKLSCGDHTLYPLKSRRWGNFIFMILQDSYGEESQKPIPPCSSLLPQHWRLVCTISFESRKNLCPLAKTMLATTKCPDFQVLLLTYTLSPCESAFISMILKFYCISESPGRFSKTQTARPELVFDSVGMGLGLRMRISKFLGDMDSCGPVENYPLIPFSPQVLKLTHYALWIQSLLIARSRIFSACLLSCCKANDSSLRSHFF